MHIKTIASATILAAALGFSGVAYAQTMIGNQNVSEADMERVKVYCEDLQTAANQAVGAGDNATESVDESAMETDESPTAIGNVDLDAVTLENCIEAGFIEATP